MMFMFFMEGMHWCSFPIAILMCHRVFTIFSSLDFTFSSFFFLPNSPELCVIESRTLTTPVELIKCLKSIKEHAFSASPYPVIITLEDHLTPDLQAKVAKVASFLLQILTGCYIYSELKFYAKICLVCR